MCTAWFAVFPSIVTFTNLAMRDAKGCCTPSAVATAVFPDASATNCQRLPSTDVSIRYLYERVPSQYVVRCTYLALPVPQHLVAALPVQGPRIEHLSLLSG